MGIAERAHCMQGALWRTSGRGSDSLSAGAKTGEREEERWPHFAGQSAHPLVRKQAVSQSHCTILQARVLAAQVARSAEASCSALHVTCTTMQACRSNCRLVLYRSCHDSVRHQLRARFHPIGPQAAFSTEQSQDLQTAVVQD